MRLIALGTTGYHPTPTRHTPCFLLPEEGILLDAGTGAFRLPNCLETDHLDIYLSHAHLDHVIGLTFFLDILYQHPLESLRVHGEAEKLEAVREHLFSELLFPAMPPIEWVELDPSGSQPFAKDGRLTWFPLTHKGGSVGFRFDWLDHSLAYVTDTSAATDADYLEHIHGADLLIHECYFPDDWAEFAVSKGHSSTTAVAELAREANAGQLLLTHFNPLANDDDDPVGLERARSVFPNTVLATDMLEVEF